MKSIVAASTAVVIAVSALTVTPAAHAAPLGVPAVAAAQSDVTAAGHRGRPHHGHHRRPHHGHGGAAAAGIVFGLSALAIGGALAAQSRPRCYIEQVEVWSPRRQAFVIRDREVCR